MKPRAKKLSPIEARTFKQICTLPRDNVDTRHFWIMLDNPFVIICEQMGGKAATNKLRIPRAEFDKLARWYVTGRKSK